MYTKLTSYVYTDAFTDIVGPMPVTCAPYICFAIRSVRCPLAGNCLATWVACTLELQGLMHGQRDARNEKHR